MAYHYVLSLQGIGGPEKRTWCILMQFCLAKDETEVADEFQRAVDLIQAMTVEKFSASLC